MMRRTLNVLADRVATASYCALVMAAWGLIGPARVNAGDGPDPIFEKPEPVTMAELAKRTTPGVSALEMNDYLLPVVGGIPATAGPEPVSSLPASLVPARGRPLSWPSHPWFSVAKSVILASCVVLQGTF